MGIMDGFRKSEFVVNCRTKEEAVIFVNICYNNDIMFGSGATRTYWDDYEEETCYRGEYGDLNYCDIDFYLGEYEIIGFNKFMGQYKGLNFIEFPNID